MKKNKIFKTLNNIEKFKLKPMVSYFSLIFLNDMLIRFIKSYNEIYKYPYYTMYDIFNHDKNKDEQDYFISNVILSIIIYLIILLMFRL